MNEKTRGQMLKNALGIFWIVLGVIIAGNILDWWHISIFFRGWWTLFIIIPCAAGVVKKGFHSGSGFGLVLGILLLLGQFRLFSFGWMFKLIIPVLLIFFGLKIILQGTRFRGNVTHNIPDEFAEYGDCSGIFRSQETRYPEDNYFGSEVNAIFGGADLDLRHAIIDEDVTVNATAVFGGVTIMLPEDVNVRVASTAILGGTDNRINRPENPDWPTVYIHATAIFGGVEIK